MKNSDTPIGMKIKSIIERSFSIESEQFMTGWLLARYGEIFIDDESDIDNILFQELKKHGITYMMERKNRIRITPKFGEVAWTN